jgi:hypothetical protein
MTTKLLQGNKYSKMNTICMALSLEMLEHSGICILLSITNMGGVSPQIKKK